MVLFILLAEFRRNLISISMLPVSVNEYTPHFTVSVFHIKQHNEQVERFFCVFFFLLLKEKNDKSDQQECA